MPGVKARVRRVRSFELDVRRETGNPFDPSAYRSLDGANRVSGLSASSVREDGARANITNTRAAARASCSGLLGLPTLSLFRSNRLAAQRSTLLRA